jgi:hypothetical protein
MKPTMISSSEELTQLLSPFLDHYLRVDGQKRYHLPYIFYWNGKSYVGAGNNNIHVMIPKDLVDFSVLYEEFQPMERMLDSLTLSEQGIIELSVLDKKRRGNSIASVLNEVGVHRKNIGLIYCFSEKFGIQEWTQIHKAPNGVNLLESQGCLIMFMPYLTDTDDQCEDALSVDDIPLFDINELEELSNEQANVIAGMKQSIYFPQLKTLSVDAAKRLSYHYAFEKISFSCTDTSKTLSFWDYLEETYPEGKDILNEDERSYLHFSSALNISDEVLDCLIESYSDLKFDDSDLKHKYESNRELILTKRIFNRFSELLIVNEQIDIVFTATLNRESWSVCDFLIKDKIIWTMCDFLIEGSENTDDEESKDLDVSSMLLKLFSDDFIGEDLQNMDSSGLLIKLFEDYEQFKNLSFVDRNKIHLEYHSIYNIDLKNKKIDYKRALIK